MVVEGPGDEAVDDGHEGVGFGGEGVFDAWWDFGVKVAADEAVGLEDFEGRGEHFGRYVGEGATYGVESRGIVLRQYAQHEDRPFAGKP